MKFDTLIKLGSLAFGVAQDEKIRELLKLAHNGAKRRGLIPPASPPGPTFGAGHGYRPGWHPSHWPR